MEIIPKIKVYAIKTIHLLVRIYWFIFCPESLGVKVILKSPQEKFLLVRLTYYPNTWTFPGGGVLKGEDITTAAGRELREETGIKIDKQSFALIGQLEFNHEHKIDTLHIFNAISDEVQPIADGIEIAEVKWFPKNEFPPMGPNARRIFDFYERN